MLQWEDSAAGAPPARACFSGDSLVRTVDGVREMSELRVGDLVLVPAADGALRYERVALFYHREPHTIARFVQLTTEGGKRLALTGKCGRHFLASRVSFQLSICCPSVSMAANWLLLVS